ncbi:MAG TPA: type II toxin-antitoxin system prevent-host-death family antitoxin [Nocardioidaceae bacterium]|nr:type II toxin-antitoxin system prevent-host-death family antitoxin [Nocardioidaceae bacterium]
MDTIPQKQLRNQVGEVLRRVEAGETFTVTVAGRPVAELAPARRRRWVSGRDLAGVWHGPAPRSLESDLAHLDAALSDPFRR